MFTTTTMSSAASIKSDDVLIISLIYVWLREFQYSTVGQYSPERYGIKVYFFVRLLNTIQSSV